MGIINGKGWLNVLVVCFCPAFSAPYDRIEWWMAAATGESADASLGNQGTMGDPGRTWPWQWPLRSSP